MLSDDLIHRIIMAIIFFLPVTVILLILMTAANPAECRYPPNGIYCNPTDILLERMRKEKPVPAHDWTHPDFVRDTIQQRQWLQQQKRPFTKHTCCSEADSEQVDEEIRYDEKGIGRYWIQSRHTRGEWMLVPEETIIREPNLHGRPVAWFRWVDGRGSTAAVPRDDMQPVIFCFAPGPLL